MHAPVGDAQAFHARRTSPDNGYTRFVELVKCVYVSVCVPGHVGRAHLRVSLWASDLRSTVV